MLVHRPPTLHFAHVLRSPLAFLRASPIEFQSISPCLGLLVYVSLLCCTCSRFIPRRDASLMIQLMMQHLLSAWLHTLALRLPLLTLLILVALVDCSSSRASQGVPFVCLDIMPLKSCRHIGNESHAPVSSTLLAEGLCPSFMRCANWFRPSMGSSGERL